MSESFKLENKENEDERALSRMQHRDSHVSTISTASSTIVFGDISAEALSIWSQLPEEVRLNPSPDVVRAQYERIRKEISWTEAEFTGVTVESELEGRCYYLNMSLAQQPDPVDQDVEVEDRRVIKKLPESKIASISRYIKLTILVSCWMFFFFILMVTKEKVENFHQISVPNYKIKTIVLVNDIYDDRISVTIEGSLLPDTNTNTSTSFSLPYSNLSIWLELMPDEEKYTDNQLLKAKTAKNVSEEWVLPVLPPEYAEIFPTQRRTNMFHLKFYPEKLSDRVVAIKLKSNSEVTIPLSIAYDLSPIDVEVGIAMGAFVLVGLYVLIIFEVVHRTIAAVSAAMSAIAILAAMNEKPSIAEITSWVDIDTLILLFSMMIIVAIIADTGIFDNLAVYAFKITNGEMWPLISTLCFFTSFISSFLDNVTTVMIMTPVTIRLCEVMDLNPVPVLTAMVIFSNIGGAMTPVGDPPNVIIASNKHVVEAGIGFSTFTLHMSIGVILVLAAVYAHFRFIFRKPESLRFAEHHEIRALKHEIDIWQRAAASLSSYSKDENVVRETLVKKVKRLSHLLKKKMDELSDNARPNYYEVTLGHLQMKYPIRDKWLLAKSAFCMSLLIFLFFSHSLPFFHLPLGWTAFLCVLLLLILADTEDLDGLITRVEWSTLLFFAALFILMEALTQLGLMSWIGKKTEMIIMSVGEESRLTVAILLLLWVSSLAGALVDNVPLTTMMIRIATDLAQNKKLKLPLQPLVWALAFGACLGGNGTLIGATANVVCAGVAEQHGYRLTFVQFFKLGFPVLLTSTFTISVYLIVAHVVFEWNY